MLLANKKIEDKFNSIEEINENLQVSNDNKLVLNISEDETLHIEEKSSDDDKMLSDRMNDSSLLINGLESEVENKLQEKDDNIQIGEESKLKEHHQKKSKKKSKRKSKIDRRKKRFKNYNRAQTDLTKNEKEENLTITNRVPQGEQILNEQSNVDDYEDLLLPNNEKDEVNFKNGVESRTSDEDMEINVTDTVQNEQSDDESKADHTKAMDEKPNNVEENQTDPIVQNKLGKMRNEEDLLQVMEVELDEDGSENKENINEDDKNSSDKDSSDEKRSSLDELSVDIEEMENSIVDDALNKLNFDIMNSVPKGKFYFF